MFFLIFCLDSIWILSRVSKILDQETNYLRIHVSKTMYILAPVRYNLMYISVYGTPVRYQTLIMWRLRWWNKLRKVALASQGTQRQVPEFEYQMVQNRSRLLLVYPERRRNNSTVKGPGGPILERRKAVRLRQLCTCEDLSKRMSLTMSGKTAMNSFCSVGFVEALAASTLLSFRTQLKVTTGLRIRA